VHRRLGPQVAPAEKMAAPGLCRLVEVRSAARSCAGLEAAKEREQSRLVRATEPQRKSMEEQLLWVPVRLRERVPAALWDGLTGARAVLMLLMAPLAAQEQSPAWGEYLLQVPGWPRQASRPEVQQLWAGSFRPSELHRVFLKAHAPLGQPPDVAKPLPQGSPLLSAA
jgi:hypothetical protein